MTTETRAVDRGSIRIGHVNKVQYVKRDIKKRKCRRMKRSVPVVPMALQELFVSCRDVFKGPGTVPLPCDVDKLCRILGMFQIQSISI